MTAISILPKGTHFARVALALADTSGRGPEPAAYAERRWGEHSAPAMMLRAAVAAGNLLDDTWAGAISEARQVGAEFVEALRPLTILGRMSGYRRVPANIQVPRATASSSVHWVGQASPMTVSSMAFDSVTVPPYKLAGIVPVTQELAKLSTPAAEVVVRNDLLAAVAEMTDIALLDPDAAGETGVSPASITSSATTIAASGTTTAALRADMRRLFRALTDAGIELRAPYLIMDKQLCVQLANSVTDEYLAGLTVNGGVLAGVPVLASIAVPRDGDSPDQGRIILVDAAELLVADSDQAMIDRTGQTILQMNDAPDSPATASTQMISLFQQNLIAWRVVRPISWQLRRDEAVAVLSGCNYSE